VALLVALLAALLSYGIYSFVHLLGQRLNWRDSGRGSR